MIAFLLLSLGLIILLVGGMSLVTGASGLAARFGFSPMMIGLTIVAFGTSAPELFVGITAAIQNHSDIVFGNVIGSNIANLGLVLGAAAVIRPLELNGLIVRRELPLFLLATAVVLVLASDPMLRGLPAVLDHSDAMVLLAFFLVFVYVTVLDAINPDHADALFSDMDASELLKSPSPGPRDWLMVALGTVGLMVGGKMTIHYGVMLADVLNVPNDIVGLFVIAVGTSLPELVTSIIAAFRRESDLALGNVIGSSIFNGLAVLPLSTLVRPILVPIGGILDLVVSFFFAAALLPIFWVGNARLGRRGGVFLLLSYGLYVIARTQR